MKFMNFAGQTINFDHVSKIYVSADGVNTQYLGGGGAWVLPVSPEPLREKSDTSRQGRYSVGIRFNGDNLCEYYDTIEQCQERFDALMEILNK